MWGYIRCDIYVGFMNSVLAIPWQLVRAESAGFISIFQRSQLISLIFIVRVKFIIHNFFFFFFIFVPPVPRIYTNDKTFATNERKSRDRIYYT